MKLLKKTVSILLVMTMIVSLFTLIPLEVSAKVKKDIYRYDQWNEWSQKLDEKIAWMYDWKSIGKLTDGGVMSGNYIADYSLIQFRQRVTVSGEVNLTLMDDTATCFYSGIRVPEGATLNIYVPDGAVGDGRLIANASKCDYCAGIGSNFSRQKTLVEIRFARSDAQALPRLRSAQRLEKSNTTSTPLRLSLTWI